MRVIKFTKVATDQLISHICAQKRTHKYGHVLTDNLYSHIDIEIYVWQSAHDATHKIRNKVANQTAC